MAMDLLRITYPSTMADLPPRKPNAYGSSRMLGGSSFFLHPLYFICNYRKMELEKSHILSSTSSPYANLEFFLQTSKWAVASYYILSQSWRL
jgi:hypothetical protein